jgi:hypothetical protein
LHQFVPPQRPGRWRLRADADFMGIRGRGVRADSVATFGAVGQRLAKSNSPDKEPQVDPLNHRSGYAQCRVAPTTTTGLGAADLQYSWFISENRGYRAGTQLPDCRNFLDRVVALKRPNVPGGLGYAEVFVAEACGQPFSFIPLPHFGGASLVLVGPHYFA